MKARAREREKARDGGTEGGEGKGREGKGGDEWREFSQESTEFEFAVFVGGGDGFQKVTRFGLKEKREIWYCSEDFGGFEGGVRCSRHSGG